MGQGTIQTSTGRNQAPQQEKECARRKLGCCKIDQVVCKASTTTHDKNRVDSYEKSRPRLSHETQGCVREHDEQCSIVRLLGWRGGHGACRHMAVPHAYVELPHEQ